MVDKEAAAGVSFGSMPTLLAREAPDELAVICAGPTVVTTLTRAELDAAEQLLHEVEDRREGLTAKLQDRNREIRKLKSLIQDAQKEMHATRLDQLRQGKTHRRELRAWEEAQDTIEEQLGNWVRTDAHTSINFSRHSKVDWVEQQFRKIDPAFVDRYFTHVNNREYEPAARRLIRVATEVSGDADTVSGELTVVLDDDAGRTLGMRFETRKDAPEPSHIGFVLALLLRSKCRDFRAFAIRMR